MEKDSDWNARKGDMKENTTQIETNGETGDVSTRTDVQPDSDSELEALRTENDMLRNQIRIDKARSEMTRRLAAAGAWSPPLMFGAVRTELKFDDDGSLVNGAAIVDKLKRDYPESFAGAEQTGLIDGGAGRSRGTGLTKAALSKMSPAEIARLDWADVRRVLSER